MVLRRLSELFKEYGIEEESDVMVSDPEVEEKVLENIVSPPVEEKRCFENLPQPWHRSVLNYEGGYANHPLDRGGETNLGITFRTLERAKKLGLAPANMTVRDLTHHPEVVYAIYNVMYYQDGLCHRMPAMLSFAFYDACVNHGRGGRNARGNPVGAGMLLQYILINRYNKNITFDGVVGPASLRALNEVLEFDSVFNVTEYFNNRRELYFRRIVQSNPSQQVFLRGWLNRLEKVREMCRRKVV